MTSSLRGNNNTPPKPEILKFPKIKILVLMLCILSFYAGWQASRAYLAKECFEAGGQVSYQGSLVICAMP